MNISLSQQVSATYARNHFKEVTDKVIKEGMQVIVRKSTPFAVVLSIAEFERLQAAQEKYEEYKKKLREPVKKMTLEELRKNSTFSKYAGCMQDDYPGMTSVEVAKHWTDYVD